jgi:hypothetical protein
MTTKQAADPKAAADIKQFIFEFNFFSIKKSSLNQNYPLFLS